MSGDADQKHPTKESKNQNEYLFGGFNPSEKY